jgi:putative component of membrane protein insertase Oxa1/YidC/SpoIIIJ protein YidD
MIRHTFLHLIRLYWLLPNRYKRSCIFKETCSRYVFRKIQEGGAWAGILSFKERYHQCRSTYSIINIDEEADMIILADNSLISRNQTNL